MIVTGFLVLAWVVDHLFGMFFLRWAKRTKTESDDLILHTVRKPVYWSVALVGVYLSLTPLSLSSGFLAKVENLGLAELVLVVA